MQDLLNRMNSILNEHQFEKCQSASWLKKEAFFLLKDNIDITLGMTTTDYGEFGFIKEGKIVNNFMLGELGYNAYVEFKISSKRSDEIVEVSKLRKKYLNYLPKNPVSIKNVSVIFIGIYNYRVGDDGKLHKNWRYISNRFKLSKSIKLEDLDSEVTKVANSEEFNNIIKSEIVQGLLNKALIDHEYADKIGIRELLDGNEESYVDKIFQFIVDNKLIA